MGFSSQEGTSANSSPVFKYLPGQEAFLPTFLKPLGDIYKGDFSGGTAGMLRSLVREGGEKEVAESRKRIASTPNISNPARASLYRGAEEGAVKSAAGVIPQLFQQALQILTQYALQPPSTGTQYSSSGGGGFGVSLSGLDKLFAPTPTKP